MQVHDLVKVLKLPTHDSSLLWYLWWLPQKFIFTKFYHVIQVESRRQSVSTIREQLLKGTTKTEKLIQRRVVIKAESKSGSFPRMLRLLIRNDNNKSEWTSRWKRLLQLDDRYGYGTKRTRVQVGSGAFDQPLSISSSNSPNILLGAPGAVPVQVTNHDIVLVDEVKGSLSTAGSMCATTGIDAIRFTRRDHLPVDITGVDFFVFVVYISLDLMEGMTKIIVTIPSLWNLPQWRVTSLILMGSELSLRILMITHCASARIWAIVQARWFSSILVVSLVWILCGPCWQGYIPQTCRFCADSLSPCR